MTYVELAVATNFSFLRGASHPEELATQAKALGLAAIGVADRNSLAGAVRAHVAAKDLGLALLVGARLVPEDGPEILCYPEDRAAYGRLCRLLTLGKRRAAKGECRFSLDELIAHAEGQQLIVLPPETPEPGFVAALARLAAARPGRVRLAASLLYRGDDARRLRRLDGLARAAGLPLVAVNDVMMHHPGRKPLADVMTCIREGTTIDAAGWRLALNAERHLKAPAEIARLFAGYPEAVAESLAVAGRCRFTLDELRYEYPEELTAPKENGREETVQQALERLTWAGAAERWPRGPSAKVRQALEHELALIGQLDYAPYFLTVHDVVRFARSQGIYCQGRGSAANSAVCYCLGITAVDPERSELLFERFVSAERNEPPDIDVDFEHERREEVIQYIYGKYGRERAGLTATVICYRARGALREVGKAMGLSADTVGALSGAIWGWSSEGLPDEQVRGLGLDPADRRLRQTLDLAAGLIGFPRHLSQHVGGFVMTRGRLDELVPIENAAMTERTVIEWDKDDIDALGILKVDVLALGMLTCLRKGFDLLRRHHGRSFDLASVPSEDPAVYDMLCKADSIGVFQVESRAQMSMLPRLKPRSFYDLVVEVAIVRPGPIQGDMVHPYLRRRSGEEKVEFPSEALRQVLGRTLGVPLFQEQAMMIAIVAAGFTPGEADRLRRAMATFRRNGDIHKFRDKMVEGMVARGYEPDFAERCFRQIEGFGTYGFPESHAASFALLVYVSAWLKCHHPEVFACALLNAQPMGFYAPAQIVRDAREHGVEIREPDVNRSDWDCSLEPAADPLRGPTCALRLGLRQIKGLSQADALRLVARRGNGYPDPLILWRRAGIGQRALEALARGDALRSLGLDRREALWAIKGLPDDAPLPLFAAQGEEERGTEPAVALPRLAESEQVVQDYASLRLSLRSHPVSFLRPELARAGYAPCGRTRELEDRARLAVAGLVLVRQRPGSAKGVIFLTLEDESGIANVVIWPKVFERYRPLVLKAQLLGVAGRLQREGIVIHLVAETLVDLSDRLYELETRPRDLFVPPYSTPPRGEEKAFEEALARADEIKHGIGLDPRARPKRHRPAGPGLTIKSRDFH
ncbi:error-prone DNA polymerase, DnaE-like [Tistlia consotensis]|uniref:Error-prone DNA polymerase n=1 Tax=Tistlia consotensis USBA 355 TaxID=560819 RepID=A0A1Y6BQY8_9PROT|nr:error-prone DNA polymerase [Tistlia consotensis]SMF23606.1 error-prone DNA polymerase, DnaE-like [Tistlia consotensis USBA 355]SNR61452.1 error-prone DNA polymerase, DnaE-like [Tistlia consotensis]